MISIDQVLLLEEKVESAVKKIEQLNAENAALRSKCAELSNALAAKTEQFSSFQSDQSKIEEGILKALSRLNAVENVVLSAGEAASQTVQPSQKEDSESVSESSTVLGSPVGDSESQNPVQSEENAQGELVQSPVTESTVEIESEPVSEPHLSEQTEIPADSLVQQATEMAVASSEPNIPSAEADSAQSQTQSHSDSSNSLAPDIDFEFGDADSQAQGAESKDGNDVNEEVPAPQNFTESGDVASDFNQSVAPATEEQRSSDEQLSSEAQNPDSGAEQPMFDIF